MPVYEWRGDTPAGVAWESVGPRRRGSVMCSSLPHDTEPLHSCSAVHQEPSAVHPERRGLGTGAQACGHLCARGTVWELTRLFQHPAWVLGRF